MRFAFADPPYLGCCGLYQHHHPDGRCWDRIETHAAFIERLVAGYGDGWALSLSSSTLRAILPLCPEEVRVGAWVKPFASYKPGVNPGYAWEPVIFSGGRPLGRDVETVRDWVAANITLRRGLTGAKPREFCNWIFAMLGAAPGDELNDLFPGSGAVGAAWGHFNRRAPAPLTLAIPAQVPPCPGGTPG